MADGHAIALGALAGECREHLVAVGVVDDTHHRPAAYRQAHAYAETRNAIRVVHRAVERVDDPHPLVDRIDFRDRSITLNECEFIIVPRGVEHRPVAEKEACVLLFEPASTLNTGNVENELTLHKLNRV